MTAKNVLSKILTLLASDEVSMTEAKSANGDILSSPTFDLNEPVEVVHEDGSKTPAPDGEYTISLTDESGNENIIRIEVKDGKIQERANEEEEKNEEEMSDEKTSDVTEEYQPDESDVRKDAAGSIKSGTIKASTSNTVGSANATHTAEGNTGDNLIDQKKEFSTEDSITPGESATHTAEGNDGKDLIQRFEELSYRIDEMEKQMQKWADMMPPVDSEVTDEEAGVKMSAEDEEELPKLDGAPITDENGVKFSAEQNRKTYGKAKDSQSNFLSKLYK